jgi:tetratricopeptide (TPR) repeat protein/DNA-directed RNA polymerase subunit RPC12/RpoP
METKAFTCGSCGAELEYEPNKRALQCPYCGSQTELVKDEPEALHESDLIVPLTVDKDALHYAVEAYMASGDYTPDDLIEKALVTKLEMSYRPAYLFSGDFEATWTASFGYDRTEHYNVIEEKYDSDLKRKVRMEVTKTKTVTDWQPHSGVASGGYKFLGYAGTSISGKGVLDVIENCSSQSNAVDFSDEFLAGVPAESFALSPDHTFSHRVDGRLELLISQTVKQHAQGDHQRDWHWNRQLSRNQCSLYVPLCHAEFEYSNVTYDFWTDGTCTANCVGDRMPVDKERKSKVRRGFAPAMMVFLAGSIIMMVLGARFDIHPGTTPNDAPAAYTVATSWYGFVLLATIVYGFLRRSAIITYSKNQRKAALSTRRAERSSTANISEHDRDLLSLSYFKQERPFLARTDKDKILLLLVLACLILPAIAAFYSKGDGTVPPQNIQTDGANQPQPVENTVAAGANGQSSSLGSNDPQEPQSASAADSQPPASEQAPPTTAQGERPAQVAEPNASPLNSNQPSEADVKQSAVLNTDGLASLSSKPPDLQAAKLAFERAVQLNGNSVEALNNLGYVYSRLMDYTQAATILSKVVAMAPSRRVAQGNLGYALAKQGKVSDASDHFCQYFRLSSSLEAGKTSLRHFNNDPDPNVQAAIDAAVRNCTQ